MGFSTLGKPMKANALSDNSVKAIHRTAESLAETDQWVEEIESALSQVQEKLAKVEEAAGQGDQQLAQEVSLVHQGVDRQARALSEMDQGVTEAFAQVKSGHEDVTRYVLDLEKKIYLAQDNVQELSKFLEAVEKRIDSLPPPPPAPVIPTHDRLWSAIYLMGLVLAVEIFTRFI